MSDYPSEWDYYDQSGNYRDAYSSRNMQPTSNSAGYDQSQEVGQQPNLGGAAYGQGDVIYADRMSLEQPAQSYGGYSASGSPDYSQYAAVPPANLEQYYPPDRAQSLYSPTDGRTNDDFYPNLGKNYRLMGEGNSPASPVEERPGMDLHDQNYSYYRGLEAGLLAALEGKPVSIVSTGDGKLGVVPDSQPGSYQSSVQGADSNASVMGLAPSDQYQISESPDRRSQDQSSVLRIDATGKKHWATWDQAAMLGVAVGNTAEALARAFVAPAAVVAAVATANAPDVVNGLWTARNELAKLQNGESPNWDRALSGFSKAITFGAAAGVPAQVYRAYQPDAGDSNQVVFNRTDMRWAALPAGISAAGAFASLVFDKRARAQEERESRSNQHRGAAGLESQRVEGRDRGQEDSPSGHRKKGKGKAKAPAPGGS
ncbi:hypothetical protein [Micromonospora ureilytica]|uniref:hypothetical protein n=1 Tax=Micromonospora ureilytica TaxID=709868 RepID=UPI002E0F0B0D|nr:hypothetical protein OHB55_21945 [Micromonospora ureilytica]